MAAFNTAFGSLPTPRDQLFGNRRQTEQPAMSGQENDQNPQRSEAQGPNPSFAEMQQQGQARPAPAAAAQVAQPAMLNDLSQQLQQQGGAAPSAPAQASAAPAPASAAAGATGAPAAATGGASSSSSLRSRLEQQLTGYTGGPSAYEDPAYKAYRESQLANMEAEFGAKRSTLEEELATRGLAASSIASGRFGDLAGQQARARATMEADLMKEAAGRQEARSQFGITQFGNLAEMSGRQEVSEADIDLRAKQLQQEERLKGRELDLTQARDQASRELGYAEIGSRERLSAAEMGSRERMSAAEIASREGIAGKELTQREKEFGVTSQLDREKFAADVDYRTKQLLNEDKRLTYEEARDKANREVEQGRLAEQARANRAQEGLDTRRVTEQERANAANEAQNKLELALREKLGVGSNQLDQNRFMLELSNVLASGKLSPAERAALIAKYMPSGGAGGASVGSGGAVGGGGTGGGFGMDTGI